MRSARRVASAAGFDDGFATAEGSAATSAMIWGRGSIESPRKAVTFEGAASDAASVKTACAFVDWAE